VYIETVKQINIPIRTKAVYIETVKQINIPIRTQAVYIETVKQITQSFITTQLLSFNITET
jgi:hypothetical protein